MLNKFGNKNGFTLIEIMFIVLLLGVLLVKIGQTQQQKVEAMIVERTAAQMNDWILSILNYYEQNSDTWPSNLKNLTPSFMPSNALCSQFALGTTTADCGSYAEFQGSVMLSSNYYILSIQTSSKNIATLLAAKLQNSWLTNNSMTVNTAVPAPSNTNFQTSSNGEQRGWIVSAGLITFSSYTGVYSGLANHSSVGTQIYLPNCPTGSVGHYIIMPEEYQMNGGTGTQYAFTGSKSISYDYYPTGIHLAETKQDGTNPSLDTSDNDSTSVVFKTNTLDHYGNSTYAITTNDIPDNINTGTYSNGVPINDGIRHLGFYMTFCLPIQHLSKTYCTLSGISNHSQNCYTSTANTAPWYTDYIGLDWPQDGECSNSWMTYLSSQGDQNPGCQIMNSGTNADNNGSQYVSTTLG